MKLLVAVLTAPLDFVLVDDGDEVGDADNFVEDVERVELFEVLWLLTELVELEDCEELDELEDTIELEDEDEELELSSFDAALIPPMTELLV
jgi:hypothetical protein